MSIREKIIEIISVHSEMANVNQYLQENDDLSQLGMNSISFIKMVVDMERIFGFEFEDEALDYNKFTSFNSLCSYIEKQMSLNNVTYTEDNDDGKHDMIRKEIIRLISQCSNHIFINQPAFNDLTDINLSSVQIEKLMICIQEKFKITLDDSILYQEKLHLIDNLSKYIQDNTLSDITE